MMIDFDLLSFLVGFLILAILIVILKKKFNKSNMYLFFFSIFFLYILNVIKYTIFPIEIGTPFVADLREKLTIFSRTNIIPFKYQNIEQTFYNILLTIPFGFGLPYLKKLNYKPILLWALTFSFLIESTQFIIALLIGYPYRITDVNDIIANTFGAIVGFIIFKIFSKIIMKLLLSFTSEVTNMNSFLKYMYNVSKNH